MRKPFWIFLAMILFSLHTPLFAAPPKIILLNITGTIGPATQAYIEQGLQKAAIQQAECIILTLDTPGGFDNAIRNINHSIMTSSIPVITFVSPSGARVANASTLILYASHIAAMAPGTYLGAVSPINITSLPSLQKNEMTVSQKAIHDTTAYIQHLAELRKRNAKWETLSAQKSASLSAEDALKENVINVIALDVPDLLNKINGVSINIQEKNVSLATKNAQIESITPDEYDHILATITDPNIAYILLLVGIYGLFFELITPGVTLPGLLGLISLFLAFYAFQLLPINYTGLTLLLLGIVCIIAEWVITSFGILCIGGLIAFVAGSFLLMHSNEGVEVARSIIIAMTVVTVLFFFLILTLTIKSFRKPVVTGREAFIGSEGEVLESHAGYTIVQVHGEIWHAQCESKLQIGQKIRVKKISNLILTIEPIHSEEKLS